MDGTSAHWLLTGCKVQSDKGLLSRRLHAEKGGDESRDRASR